MFAWLVCLHKKCLFYTYLFVLEVQTNLVLQQKHNRHTHSANLDAAMTSGGFKTARDRDPDCWEHEKCCICNLSSHFFG